MKVIKALGSGVLSLLLLVSLSIFGLALLIKSTVLDANFIARQLSRLDMTAIMDEVLEERTKDLTSAEAAFFREAMHNFLTGQESWFKEQLSRAIHSGYDFLLGKSNRLEIVIPLSELKTSLQNSLWQTLQQYLATNTPAIPQELLLPYIDEHYQELIPLIPAQYLPPDMGRLKGEALKAYIHAHYEEVTLLLQQAYALPGIAPLILSELKPYFDRYYDEFIDGMPDAQVITEREIPQDVQEQLALTRSAIRYFMTVFYALIGIMVLLTAFIFLINMNLKDFTRALGIVLIIYGVAEFAGVIFARQFDFVRLMSGLPQELQDWLPGLIRDALLPLQWFSLGMLVLGIALIVISVVARPREAMT